MATTHKRSLSWRTIAWSFFLLLVGAVCCRYAHFLPIAVTAAVAHANPGASQVMLLVGLSEWYSNHERAIAMLVVGSIAFLPGAFATVIMIGAALRWKGYNLNQIPQYDD